MIASVFPFPSPPTLQRKVYRLRGLFQALKEACRIQRLERIVLLQSLWRRHAAQALVQRIVKRKAAQAEAARKIQVDLWPS